MTLMSGAPYSHRQAAQDYLLREVGNVEPRPDDDVCVTERIGVSISMRVQALVDVDVNIEAHALETDVAVGRRVRVDRSFHFEPSVCRAQSQLHRRRPLEDDPFETLDRDLVFDLHELTAAGEEPPDIDRVPPNQTRPF